MSTGTNKTRAAIVALELCVESGSDECCIWSGVNNSRYGYLKHHGRASLAHRYSFERFSGPIPEGLEIRHLCDNGMCVNPRHLSVGTHSQNEQDKRDRGRARYPKKLPDMWVLEIRRLRSRGFTLGTLAKAFGCTESHVSRIVSGLSRSGVTA